MIVIFVVEGLFTAPSLLAAVAAGLFCSVVPYALDLVALRRVPTPVFGVFMSIHPVVAAIAGLLVLHQVPVAHEWIGIAIIVAVNATITGMRRGR